MLGPPLFPHPDSVVTVEDQAATTESDAFPAIMSEGDTVLYNCSGARGDLSSSVTALGWATQEGATIDLVELAARRDGILVQAKALDECLRTEAAKVQ